MNITLHDYIRGITNVHHSTSTWTIEPRVDILNDDGSRAVELGVGNQVSSEFNLLYRFHSAVSQRDDKWTAMFFKEVFGDRKPEDIPVQDFIVGALAWEAKIPKEPSERVFGGLKRNPETGMFDDDAMVQILKESIEDPAGKSSAASPVVFSSLDLTLSLPQVLSAQGMSPNTCEQSISWVFCKLGNGEILGWILTRVITRNVD